MSKPATELELAYAATGQTVTVRDISPGYYEVVKPRLRQVITHRDLTNEIERLTR